MSLSQTFLCLLLFGLLPEVVLSLRYGACLWTQELFLLVPKTGALSPGTALPH